MVGKGTPVRIRFGFPFSSKFVDHKTWNINKLWNISQNVWLTKILKSAALTVFDSKQYARSAIMLTHVDCCDWLQQLITPHYLEHVLPFLNCEPVWPSGMALLSLKKKKKRLWFVGTVLWLCPSLPTETLKWPSSLPILMQKSFWWWQCSDRYIISLSPHLHTPFSPSLISRTVSVDVKHHAYLLSKREWAGLA